MSIPPSEDEIATIFGSAQRWLAEGHRVAIATVLETWGSAPRRVGAHAVMRDDGLFEGSVSGGCVEGDVIETARILLAQGGGFRRLEYGVVDDRAWEVGLACGGRIAVLVQTVDDRNYPPALIAEVMAARERGDTLTVATSLDTGLSRTVGETETAGVADFRHIHRPMLRLIVAGAVHITQALVPMARMAGYRALIVDPRESYAAAARFVDDRVDTRFPDEAMADWKPDASTAVVTLTHDPKIDDPALHAALRSPAFYIASLGSRRTQAARLERLRAAGFDDAALARINGPAGLPIGAANPAEIAISIMAQMTAALRALP